MNVCTGDMLKIFMFIGKILTIIEIAVPILLIIMGSIDFTKAVMSGNDDEIKKSQSSFVKRMIAAVIVFFVPTIVGLVLSLLNQTKSACITCVLNTSTCNITDNTYNSNTLQNEYCDIEDEDCINYAIYEEE